MSEPKATQPRITLRLGWAALALWLGMTVLQLALFGMSSSYRESAAAVSAGWGGCWAWRLAGSAL